MGISYEKRSLKELREQELYRRQRDAAAAIAFVILAESGQIDDVTAAEQSLLFEKWEPKVDYSVGNLRQYGEGLYRCVQAHTSQMGWEPDVTTSLWKITSDPAEEWPAWSRPVGAHDAYSAGDKVTHNDLHWVSAVNGNVWEPGTVGEDIWRKKEA